MISSKPIHKWKVGDVVHKYEDASIIQVETVTKIDNTNDRYTVHYTRAVTYKKAQINSAHHEELNRQAGETCVTKHTISSQKFLCVGGPADGEKGIEELAGCHGYVRYNAASPGHRAKYRRKSKNPSSILVWLPK